MLSNASGLMICHVQDLTLEFHRNGEHENFPFTTILSSFGVAFAFVP
jgi:hypothetical protein